MFKQVVIMSREISFSSGLGLKGLKHFFVLWIRCKCMGWFNMTSEKMTTFLIKISEVNSMPWKRTNFRHIFETSHWFQPCVLHGSSSTSWLKNTEIDGPKWEFCENLATKSQLLQSTGTINPQNPSEKPPPHPYPPVISLPGYRPIYLLKKYIPMISTPSPHKKAPLQT